MSTKPLVQRVSYAALPLAVGFAATQAAAYAFHSRALLAVAALWLIAVPIILARVVGRRFDPFDPFWLFSAVFIFVYALVPAAQLWRPASFQSLPGYLAFSPPHYYAAMWLGGAGLFVFCIAYLLPVRWFGRLGRTSSRERAGQYGLVVVGCVLVAIGLIAFEANLRLADFTAASPKEILAGDLRNALLHTELGRGYLNVGYLALSTGLICLALAVFHWAREGPRRQLWVWAYLGLATAVTVVVFLLVLGSRNLGVETLVGLLVAFHYRYRRIPTRIVVPVLVILGLAAVEILSYRESHAATVDPIAMAGYASKTFDGFNFLANALARVHHLLFGKTIGQDLLYTYLPRQLFPGKPTAYGIVVAQNTIVPGLSATAGSGTFPPGILAEGYLNFGLAGLFALPALAALLLRLSYDWVTKTASTVAIVIFGFLLGNPTGVFRGFGPVLPTLVVLLILLLGLQIPERLFHRARVLTLPAAGVFLAIAVAIPAALHPQVTSPTSIGQPTPPPTHLAALPAGVQRVVAQSGGRPTMVVFWSSWCSGCETALKEAAATAKSASLSMVGVNFQDTTARREYVIARTGVTSPQVSDDGTATISFFHISNLPSIVFLRGRALLCEVSGPTALGNLQAAASSAAESGDC